MRQITTCLDRNPTGFCNSQLRDNLNGKNRMDDADGCSALAPRASGRAYPNTTSATARVASSGRSRDRLSVTSVSMPSTGQKLTRLT